CAAKEKSARARFAMGKAARFVGQFEQAYAARLWPFGASVWCSRGVSTSAPPQAKDFSQHGGPRQASEAIGNCRRGRAIGPHLLENFDTVIGPRNVGAHDSSRRRRSDSGAAHRHGVRDHLKAATAIVTY